MVIIYGKKMLSVTERERWVSEGSSKVRVNERADDAIPVNHNRQGCLCVVRMDASFQGRMQEPEAPPGSRMRTVCQQSSVAGEEICLM